MRNRENSWQMFRGQQVGQQWSRIWRMSRYMDWGGMAKEFVLSHRQRSRNTGSCQIWLMRQREGRMQREEYLPRAAMDMIRRRLRRMKMRS